MESSELKLLFIEEALSVHGEWLCDILREAIEKQKLERTEELKQSISDQAFKDGNGNPGLRLKFLSYGRAFEIAGHERKRLNRLDRNTNRFIWGIKSNKDFASKMRKNTRWYARNMYGGLNKLVSKIMYGLSEYEIERLKGILENRKNGTLESRLNVGN